ncbi:MAG: hypothetical protein H6713_40860 [Myxococcales bacterium]|nr:hypothetical protein [Myxococcales bacterium]
MQTTRIPFHILVGLRLTVGADACGGVSACLSMAPTDSSTASSTDTTEGVSSTSAGTSAGTSGSSATTDISTGPCLGAPYTTEDPPATSSESDTGTGSTSDTTATTGETDTRTTSATAPPRGRASRPCRPATCSLTIRSRRPAPRSSRSPVAAPSSSACSPGMTCRRTCSRAPAYAYAAGRLDARVA